MPATGLAQDAHDRDSWYIGFGLGSGWASLTTGDETNSYTEIFDDLKLESTRASVNFQVGATVSPNLLVGLDVSGMGEIGEKGGVTVQLQHNHYLAAATFFPNGEGVFVRGGAGLAAVVRIS